ncbi:MAG: hypothetical protein J6B40_07815 [Oscillospiraceae bacterium]|nr:hypothetical protein [Oscillospiraceae bacterium]
MKKAIALTLALAMASSMSAIALAGDEPIAPNTYAPGSVISIEAGAFADANGAAPTAELNRNNFTVSADWDKGTTMVDTVRIDNDDNEVQITLKESYTITEARALEGTISLKAKSEDKTVYTMDLTEDNGLKVNNLVVTVEGVKDIEDSEIHNAEADNTIYHNDEYSSGYVTFKSGSDLLTVVLDMAKNEKVFMHIDEEEMEEVAEKYNKDDTADLYFFNFEGTPSLKNKATLSIEADYLEDVHVYEYTDGKLREVTVEMNKDEDAYEWTSSKLTTYVVSDSKLKADGTVSGTEDNKTEGDKTETNPDTGANDIVNVAAGLAVVSLIAAGAVVLKKKDN